MTTLESIPLGVPKKIILKGGWFGLCSFTTILKWCKTMDSSHSYIPNVQATIVASFSSMNTFCTSPYFLDLLFPFKWFKREVRRVCQCLLVFLKKVYPFSNASIVPSKDLMLWMQKSSKQRFLKDMNKPWQRHIYA
jgi:hypothetical protein